MLSSWTTLLTLAESFVTAKTTAVVLALLGMYPSLVFASTPPDQSQFWISWYLRGDHQEVPWPTHWWWGSSPSGSLCRHSSPERLEANHHRTPTIPNQRVQCWCLWCSLWNFGHEYSWSIPTWSPISQRQLPCCHQIQWFMEAWAFKQVRLSQFSLRTFSDLNSSSSTLPMFKEIERERQPKLAVTQASPKGKEKYVATTLEYCLSLLTWYLQDYDHSNYSNCLWGWFCRWWCYCSLRFPSCCQWWYCGLPNCTQVLIMIILCINPVALIWLHSCYLLFFPFFHWRPQLCGQLLLRLFHTILRSLRPSDSYAGSIKIFDEKA